MSAPCLFPSSACLAVFAHFYVRFFCLIRWFSELIFCEHTGNPPSPLLTFLDYSRSTILAFSQRIWLATHTRCTSANTHTHKHTSTQALFLSCSLCRGNTRKQMCLAGEKGGRPKDSTKEEHTHTQTGRNSVSHSLSLWSPEDR